jgi:hypothetical protein
LAGEEWTFEEKEIHDNLKPKIDNLYQTTIFNELNEFTPSAELVAKIYKGTDASQSLIEILHTAIEEEVLWVCAPIYRDAILFYDDSDQLINGINICFECDRIESISGEHIATDFKTFKYLKQLLLTLGHPIEAPDKFKADELINTIKQYKGKN